MSSLSKLESLTGLEIQWYFWWQLSDGRVTTSCQDFSKPPVRLVILTKQKIIARTMQKLGKYLVSDLIQHTREYHKLPIYNDSTDGMEHQAHRFIIYIPKSVRNRLLVSQAQLRI